MAVDMFVLMGDKIKGETKDKEFSGDGGIDILAWSWGMSQSGSFHMGSGGGAGKANVQDLSFTKYVDKASAPLMQNCLTGDHIPKVDLYVRKAGGDPKKYIHITLNKVLVTSVSTGGSGGEDLLTENVTLNFAEVTYEYFMQDEKGETSSAGKYTYDIEKNAQE